MNLNIMMDPRPLYPNMFHPASPLSNRDFVGLAKHGTRTRHPVKYYWIDFGLSRKYEADNLAPLEEVICGGDKTVPEFQTEVDGNDLNFEDPLPCNPFYTDISYIGNLIREDFLEVRDAAF